jgi:hypothetical protein
MTTPPYGFALTGYHRHAIIGRPDVHLVPRRRPNTSRSRQDGADLEVSIAPRRWCRSACGRRTGRRGGSRAACSRGGGRGRWWFLRRRPQARCPVPARAGPRGDFRNSPAALASSCIIPSLCCLPGHSRHGISPKRHSPSVLLCSSFQRPPPPVPTMLSAAVEPR